MHPNDYVKYAKFSMNKEKDNAEYLFHRRMSRKVAIMAAEETITNLATRFPGIELKKDIKTLPNWWTYMFQDITYIEISGDYSQAGVSTTFKIRYGRYTTKVKYSGPLGDKIVEDFMLLPTRLLFRYFR